MKNIIVRRIISAMIGFVLIFYDVFLQELYMTISQYLMTIFITIGVFAFIRFYTKVSVERIYGTFVGILLIALILVAVTYWLDVFSKEQLKPVVPWFKPLLTGWIIAWLNDRATIEYGLKKRK